MAETTKEMSGCANAWHYRAATEEIVSPKGIRKRTSGAAPSFTVMLWRKNPAALCQATMVCLPGGSRSVEIGRVRRILCTSESDRPQ